jgi:CHAT domain-containing protein
MLSRAFWGMFFLWSVSCSNVKSVTELERVCPPAIQDYIHKEHIDPLFRNADSLKYSRNYPAALSAFITISERMDLNDEHLSYSWNQVAYLYLLLHKDSLAQVWSERLRLHFGRVDKLSPGAQADWNYNAGVIAMRFFRPNEAKQHIEKAIVGYDALYLNRPHLRRALAYTQLSMVAYHFGLSNKPCYDNAHKAYLMAHQDTAIWLHSIEIEQTMMFIGLRKRKHDEARAHSKNVIYLAEQMPYPDTLALAFAHYLEGRIMRYEANLDQKTTRSEKKLFVDKINKSIDLGKAVDGPHQMELIKSLAFCYFDDRQKFDSVMMMIPPLEKRWGAHYSFTHRMYGYYYYSYEKKGEKNCIYHMSRFLKEHQSDPTISAELREEPLMFLSDSYAALGQFDTALYYLSRLFDLSDTVGTSSPQTIFRSDFYKKTDYPFWLLTKVGNLLLNRYNKEKGNNETLLHQALRSFELSDSLLFSYNAVYDDETIYNYHHEIGQDLYCGALETLYLLDSIHPNDKRYCNAALHYMDRQKSDVLFRFLPENLPIDSLRNLKHTIEGLMAQGDKLPLKDNRLLAYSLFRLSQINATGKMQQPQQQLNASEEQKLLSPKQAVLHYKLSETSLFTLYLAADKVLLRRVQFKKDTLQNSIKKLLLLRKTPTYGNSDMQTDQNLSYYLYKNLVAPFKKELSQKSDWLFAPDDCIFQLAFEGICYSPYSVQQQTPPFLVTEDSTRTFTYTPAWKIWRTKKNKSNSISGTLPAAFFSYGKDEQGHPIENFAYSDSEFMALKKYNPRTQKYTNKNCTTAQFREVWQNSTNSIIHLSLHGLADTQFALVNRIWFGPEHHDPLFGFEAAHLKGRVNLMVLSVCESNTGTVRTGEGIHALSRNFLQAGAERVIASLTEIDNYENSIQVNYFYQEKAKHKHIEDAQALSDAKRLYLKGKSIENPAYWASMVLLE